MSATFQPGSVYSNEKLVAVRSKSIVDHFSFYINLYKGKEEQCPWPKARQLYINHVDNWKNNIINYIIVIRRTKRYLIIETFYGFQEKKLIRYDKNLTEYIILDNVIISANDIMNYDATTAIIKKENEYSARNRGVRFIEKVMHLEEYGYVYLSNLERIDSMEKLCKTFNK